MLLLLPLLWLWSAWARDEGLPKDTKYVIKKATTCPDEGYFFKRESSPNALTGHVCYLCFCQSDGTAICWKRENSRCDAKHYEHGLGKRDTRVRRSPGLLDMFFRDATREVFNKQLPQTCKPYETSFSEGCPPEDWCAGCTVCDCDAHGRWDCHILSFCPDKDKKRGVKDKKKSAKVNDFPPPKLAKMMAKKKANNSSMKKPPNKKTTPKPPTRKYNQPANKQIKNMGRSKPNNNIEKKSNSSTRPLIIHKAKKPLLKKTDHNKISFNKNDTVKLTQEVYKKVASAIHKMISKKYAINMPSVKNMKKRSLEKKTQPCVKNSKNAKKNVKGQFKSAGPNKKQYNKAIAKRATSTKKQFIPSKTKYVPVKKKPTPPKYNKQTNKVKRESVKSIAKKMPAKQAPAKKGPTKKPVTKKSTKPLRRAWRTKRDIHYDNATDTVSNSTVGDRESNYSNIISQLTTVEDKVTSNVTAPNNYFTYSVITPQPLHETKNKTEIKTANMSVSSRVDTIPNNISYLTYAKDKSNISTETMTSKIKSLHEKNISSDNAMTSKIKNMHEKNISIDDMIPEYNDLKFKKRSQIKLIKKSRFLDKLFVKLRGMNSSEYNDKVTPKNNISDLKKIVTPRPFRKYNRSKIINTIRSPNRQNGILNKTFRDRVFNKIDGLQNILKKLLEALRQDKVEKAKPKRFNVLKYLKKFFRKFFRKSSKNRIITVNNKAILTKHIINSICDNFDNCDLKEIENPIVHRKIKELYADSFAILRTINIIKGLLHFLENSDNASSKLKDDDDQLKNKFNHDIVKLGSILKDQYIDERKLTSTEITQVKYIKQNTKAFISSVGRFANKLNEIIDILTHKSDENKTLVTREANQKKKINASPDLLIRLKDFFERYSMIQSKSIQNIQKSINEYTKLNNNCVDLKDRVNKNKTDEVLRYTGKIIRNLQKLKTVAAALARKAAEQKADKHRRKRDAMRDDDAMEYLLTLMEYLLKQNKPLDSAPVNDGIDLLIEAIKNAPDIKPIKKKVLQNIPVSVPVLQSNEQPHNFSREDITIETNKISKEENDTNETRSETVEHVSFQEREQDQTPNGRLIFEDTNTESVYYKKLPEIPYDKKEYDVQDAPEIHEAPDVSEFTKAPMFETTVVPGAYGLKSHVEDVTEHNNFDKLEKQIKEDDKKIEVFGGDSDDDDEASSTTLASDGFGEKIESVTITVPIVTTDFKLPEIKQRQVNVKSIDVSGSSDGDRRITMDWLDEGEEQDTREMKIVHNATTTKASTYKETTKVLTTTAKPHMDNISSITREFSDEDVRRKKTSIEDIMYKKQMDLLNSLDYGTERSENEEGDSKDGDERYSGDVFQTYF